MTRFLSICAFAFPFFRECRRSVRHLGADVVNYDLQLYLSMTDVQALLDFLLVFNGFMSLPIRKQNQITQKSHDLKSIVNGFPFLLYPSLRGVTVMYDNGLMFVDYEMGAMEDNGIEWKICPFLGMPE